MTAAATVSMPKTKRRFRTGTIVLAVAGIIFVVMAILVNTQDAFKQYTWLRVFFGVSALNFTLRASVPLIRALNRQAEDWGTAELKRARHGLARGEDIDAVLQTLARGLTAKLLHGPLAELRSADPAHREQVSQTVTRLFLRCPQRGGSRSEPH